MITSHDHHHQTQPLELMKVQLLHKTFVLFLHILQCLAEGPDSFSHNSFAPAVHFFSFCFAARTLQAYKGQGGLFKDVIGPAECQSKRANGLLALGLLTIVSYGPVYL